MAYDKGEYGFATNYARLDILKQQGGIYLDVDVEAIKSFDMLLKDKTFFNMGCADRVNMGCGFGTIPNQKIIDDIMDLNYQTVFRTSMVWCCIRARLCRR